MRRHRGRALVIGTDTRAFLAVVRSLGRAGIEVEATGLDDDAPAARSSYLAVVHELPRFAPGQGDWAEALAALLRERPMDLVIPCPDWAVFALDRSRSALEPLARLAIPSPLALATFMDKRRTRDLADRVGVPAPLEWRLASAAEVGALAGEPLPLVVKPCSSLDPRDPLAKRLVVKARTRAELAAAVEREAPHGPVIVQRNVTGPGVGVEVLASEGEVVAAFQHERVHEPIDGGGSSYRRSVALAPDLLEAAERLVAAVDLTGVAMVEFKQDGEVAWLMEVNPRFWGSLPLAVAAGADFPAALYDLLVEGRRPSAWHPVEGLHCRNLASDARWWRQTLRLGGRRAGAPAFLRLGRELAASARRALAGRERLDTLVRDDPAPGRAELARLVIRGRRAALLRAAAWPPLRRPLAARARRALRSPGAVVFLCRGNICRSPFAEAVLREQRPDAPIGSAGSFPRAGRPVPETAVEIAGGLGVDLGPHRSRVATRELLRDADAVFVFDLGDWASARDRYGVGLRRLHFVGALDRAAPLDIADPWGGNEEVMLATYERIRVALQVDQG